MRDQLQLKVITVIKQFEGKLSQYFFDDYLSDAEQGEWGMALENLTVQLFEKNIKPSKEQLEEIKSLSKVMRLPKSAWDHFDS